MRNEKGFLVFGLMFVPFVAMTVGVTLLAMCAWHIPAWERAKDSHCEASYQTGNMACGK